MSLAGSAYDNKNLEGIMKLKRFLFCFLLAAILILSPSVVLAEDGDTQEKTEEELAAEAEAQEKASSYESKIDTNGLEAWPEGPRVYADSAVVMDMESGAILYGKNMDAKHFPASITKLLTTLVALENADLADKVKFTEDSISFLQYDDAQIGMKAGEELSLDDSLHAVLLASANEVSHAVAESVGEQRLGGNYDTFIQKMNDRAKELGCTNSHWVNPNGLHDDEHYTTAHDMALIASAVYQQPEFRTIMGTLEYKIGPTNLTQEERVFQQNHKMLWPENYYYYEYCTGGKTGYTDQAKTTLVTMADNGDMHLAAVVLYDYGVDAYTDTRAMMDYVFSNFKKVPVETLETSEDISNFNTENPYVVLPQSVNFSSLEKNIVLTENGIRDGKIIYTYKGQAVGSAEVTLTEEGYQKLMGDTAASDSRKIENKQETQPAPTEPAKDEKAEQPRLKLYVGIGSAAVLLILIIAGSVMLHRKNRNRKE
ncbi:MAG: D-alanyl-D-alanine carboxypeptidase [Clostridium sp.]|nr:D-alanyl-D-alanine carboxypeptidase [Clostridium sp.]